MNHDVFISYSSQNMDAAQAICHVLEQNDIRCWMAPRNIPPGSDYGDIIDDAIKACKVVVVLFSETAATSQWVKGELNVAFEEQKTIIPFRLDKTPLKGQTRVMLSQRHWIDAYPDYNTKFNDLVTAVAHSIGKKDSLTVNATNDENRENEKEEKNWYRCIFHEDFHPLMRFVIALQIIFYSVATFNFVWTMLWGCLAFYHHFQISLFLLCCCLFLSLFSTIQLRSRKILWWAAIVLLDYISTFYLCVVAKYLYANWPLFSTLQIPSSMRYRLLYVLGKRMGDFDFVHPYLLLFAVLHTILICVVLCIKHKGRTGWQMFK